MTLSDRPTRAIPGYTASQIGLHWLIAALVSTQLIFGESMNEAIEAAADGEPISALSTNLSDMHYYFGIVILALVAVRLALQLWNGAPPLRPCAARLPHRSERWPRRH